MRAPVTISAVYLLGTIVALLLLLSGVGAIPILIFLVVWRGLTAGR